MSCDLRALDRRILILSTLLLPSCLALSACGGGTSVASIPPPPPTPTPTPTPPPAQGATIDVKLAGLDSPAIRGGNYGLMGRLTLAPGNGGPSSYRSISSGEFTMNTGKYFDDDPLTYTLKVAHGLFPETLTSTSVTQPYLSWDFNLPPGESYHYDNPYGDYCCQELGQRLTAFSKAADGTETKFLTYDFTQGSSTSFQPLGTDKQLKTALTYDIGYSYVAMGEWSWGVVDLNGAAAGGDSGDVLFVNGDRTPGTGIPTSGTATYDARTLGAMSSGTIPFTLTADFGRRSISTEISKPSVFDVSGSAPFTNNGNFDIPLTGTADARGATGDMNGAFFGPHAEQVGGTFSVGAAGGGVLLQDAFVGQQKPH